LAAPVDRADTACDASAAYVSIPSSRDVARLIEQLLGSFAVARRAPCEEHLVQLAA
jgi:hypothetical protein